MLILIEKANFHLFNLKTTLIMKTTTNSYVLLNVRHLVQKIKIPGIIIPLFTITGILSSCNKNQHEEVGSGIPKDIPCDVQLPSVKIRRCNSIQ